MSLSMQLLVVEDDVDLLTSLKMVFEDEGFTVFTAETCQEARYLIKSWQFDAILLDGHLPDGDCLVVLKEIRIKDKATPVMMLTGRTLTSDKVNGLDSGADAYVTKPFEFDELIARVYAMIRRWTAGNGFEIRVGDLCINYRKRLVCLAEKELKLSNQEYAVLISMALRKGQVLTRQQLFDRLCHGDKDVESNLLDVIIHTLRLKIGKSLIHTLKTQGYRLSL